ncbi:hypothetical protein C8Q79DRAFT_557750 [Trametes meyenii]|nr:hypothetical protein C8Q79DRAFT_557750 [Trametes meyenii]
MSPIYSFSEALVTASSLLTDNMDACPPEIQILILSYACTDDGSTGRSLSLVSRSFRELSYPFQWNSLSIYGHDQATAFTKMLYSQLPMSFSHRPILHLFVSTRTSSEALDHVTIQTPSTWPGILRSIIRYAAPTLQTLAVVCFEAPMDSAIILSQVLRIHYLCLTELTIRGRCTPLQLSQPSSLFIERSDHALGDTGVEDEPVQTTMDVATWPPIPTLRRLHLACAFQGLARGTQAEHALVNGLAPSLTHLRLSVLDLWGSNRIAEILHAECAESGVASPTLTVWPTGGPPPAVNFPTIATRRASSARTSSNRLSLARLPPLTHAAVGRAASPDPGPATRKAIRVTWDKVIPQYGTFIMFAFQPPPTELADFYCSCCMDVRGDGDVMRVFEALARASDERFLYVPCLKKSGYSFEEAKTDWLARIEGSPGCWGARQEERERQIAVGAGVSHPTAEQALDRPPNGRHRRAISFKAAVKQLQKVKFW